MKTPAEWAALKEWFGVALEAPPDQINEVLRAARLESPALAAELQSLLGEHHQSYLGTQQFRDAVPAALAAQEADAQPGAAVGPYRIIRELGRGGTGVVLLAERADDEFHRPVALKLLRYVSWDSRGRDLLTMERRSLSQMHHANIAALLDWGETPEGAPWLATEFVEGEPIDAYCRSRALDVPATLAIFRQVCEAVQYAHRRLIVHRDLKPANILVGELGLIKLLDFGISKPLEDLSVTVEGDRRFTPAYASPEQLKGEPITAATDVYALGLLLYELLTGSLPHGIGTLEGISRRLEDEPFTPPSSAAGLPRGYRHAIKGDLDRIVLHALERQPERRYPSVEQLLADLDAYRGGFPISVETPSAANRIWKFVRRHSVAVPMAGAAIASLAIAAGVAITEARQSERDQQVAEKRFQDLQRFSHSVIYELHDEIRSVPGTVGARRSLVTMAVRYLDGLNSEKIADDSLQQELAGAYVRMGYIQGGFMGVNLGDTPGSMRSYRTALGIYDDLWRRHPASVEIAAARFGATYHLSLMINDPAEALRFITPYAPQADDWINTNTGGQALFASDLMHAATGRIQRNLGALDIALSEFDLSADRQRRSMPIINGRTDMGPMFGTSVNMGQTLFQMCLTEFARAEALLQMGRTAEALEALTASRLALDRSTEVRNSPSNQRMAARVRGLTVRALLGLGRVDEAASQSEAELRQAQINVADGSATAQRDLAEAQWHAGSVAMARNNRAAAVAEYYKASETIRAAMDRDISFLQLRLLGAVIDNDYGRALVQVKETARAEAAFRRALELAEQGVKDTPDWVQWWRERARARSALGLRQDAAADWQELSRRSPLNREHLGERMAVTRDMTKNE